MNVTLTKDGTVYTVSNTFTMDERLDEELDGGTVEVITTTDEKIANFELVFIRLSDSSKSVTLPFFAFDSATKRAGGYYKHTLDLIEPTRLLMGLTVDGLAVTQPIDPKKAKKTLYDVLYRLIVCRKAQENLNPMPYEFLIDDATSTMLQSVTAPEFKWQEGTIFFEALQDIADVVNCIPRLTVKGTGRKAFEITFDKINEVKGEYVLDLVV